MTVILITKITCSVEDVIIQPGDRIAISTGIRMKAPARCYIRIAGRSGLALKNGLMVGAGVIDRDYLGIVKVVLFNLDTQPYHVKKGHRIAQAIVEKYKKCGVVEVAMLEQNSERGACGFGSTGK